jgi:hypothetical protein
LRRTASPISSIESEQAKLSAQLEQLRRIRVNIDNLIASHAAETGKELSNALEVYLEEKLFAPGRLAEHVAKFNLGPLENISTRFKLLGDFWRDESDKISTHIANHLQSEVKNLIVRCLGEWRQVFLELTVKTKAEELEKKLKYEAGEYVKVVSEIHGAGGGARRHRTKLPAKYGNGCPVITPI